MKYYTNSDKEGLFYVFFNDDQDFILNINEETIKDAVIAALESTAKKDENGDYLCKLYDPQDSAEKYKFEYEMYELENLYSENLKRLIKQKHGIELEEDVNLADLKDLNLLISSHPDFDWKDREGETFINLKYVIVEFSKELGYTLVQDAWEALKYLTPEETLACIPGDWENCEFDRGFIHLGSFSKEFIRLHIWHTDANGNQTLLKEDLSNETMLKIVAATQ